VLASIAETLIYILGPEVGKKIRVKSNPHSKEDPILPGH
jgi:hypothetical protein